MILTKCPECEKSGTPSKLYSHGSMVTLLSHDPYYDEQGVFHNHDSNTVSSAFECSNGHIIRTEHIKKCPNCDYGKDSLRVWDIEEKK